MQSGVRFWRVAIRSAALLFARRQLVQKGEGDRGDGRPLHLFAIQCACVQRQLFRFGKFDAVGCGVAILP